jgi:hypothetical protein
MLGDGPLTVLGGVEGLAFVNTKYANASEDFPDIEFHFVSGSTCSDGGNIFSLKTNGFLCPINQIDFSLVYLRKNYNDRITVAL